MYMFNESTLVLECVTLAELVEVVVEVLVDLAGCPVLDQKASEDSQASHPEHLTVRHQSQRSVLICVFKQPCPNM